MIRLINWADKLCDRVIPTGKWNMALQFLVAAIFISLAPAVRYLR